MAGLVAARGTAEPDVLTGFDDSRKTAPLTCVWVVWVALRGCTPCPI